jgi:hypothetical protein
MTRCGQHREVDVDVFVEIEGHFKQEMTPCVVLFSKKRKASFLFAWLSL